MGRRGGRGGRGGRGAASRGGGGGGDQPRGGPMRPEAPEFNPSAGPAATMSTSGSGAAPAASGGDRKSGGGGRGRGGRGGRRGGRGGGKRGGARGGAAQGDAAKGSSAAQQGGVAGEQRQSQAPRASRRPERKSELAADIGERLRSGSYECMICTDVLEVHPRSQPIWHCDTCYVLFHLSCIEQWREKSGYGESPDESPHKPQNARLKWRCPGCQALSDKPPLYKCFCNRTKDPPFDPYLMPHSCGETCGRRLEQLAPVGSAAQKGGRGRGRGGQTADSSIPVCPHRCTQPCHPGSCPPCAAQGPLRTCHCGKQSYRLRCGEAQLEARRHGGRLLVESCGKVCGRTLSCGRHQCQLICHEGPCGDCELTEPLSCFCGAVAAAERPCGSGPKFRCTGTCGKDLPCGNHKCTRGCHPGDCGDCERLPKRVRTCPCGKLPLVLLANRPRKRCTDPIPVCANECGKPRECGHNCASGCHDGECPPCEFPVAMQCRCRATHENVACFEREQRLILGGDAVPRCRKQCKKLLSCNRHKCRDVCCPGDDALHECNAKCSKKLSCGIHDCEENCHAGRCPPCHITLYEKYECHCGKTVVDPPRLCGEKAPQCTFNCTRERSCGHDNSSPDNVHLCHEESACPPCAERVDVDCVGGHGEMHAVLCSVAAKGNLTCGRRCDRRLPCGKHRCRRSCHGGACVVETKSVENRSQPVSSVFAIEAAVRRASGPNDNASSTATTRSGKIPEGCCANRCLIARPCGHPCTKWCHGKADCSSEPCTAKVEVSCECGRRFEEMQCLSTAKTTDELKESRTLLCDEQCEIAKRNKRLADAFGIDRAGSPTGTTFVYSQFLLDVHRYSPNSLNKIELALGGLMRDSHTNRYAFPTMDSMQRRMVHELASYWGMTTASGGVPPHRHVVATKTPTAKAPPMTVAEAAERSLPQNKFGPRDTAKSETKEEGPLAVTPGTTLHLTNFDCPNPTQVVATALLRWQAHVVDTVWPDDLNCLVIFDDANLAATARYVLTGNPFSVSTYTDELGGGVDEIRGRVEQEQERLALEQKELWKVQSTGSSGITSGRQPAPKAAWGAENMFSVLDAKPHLPTGLAEPEEVSWGEDAVAPTGLVNVGTAPTRIPDADGVILASSSGVEEDAPESWEKLAASED